MTRNDVTMLTDLQRLIRLEPLPQNPVGTSLGDADWRDVEAVLGYRLPHDYKDYIAAYGAGRWADFLGIMSPFYRWRHPQALDFFDWIRSRLDGLDEIHQTFPQYAPPFQRHPAPAGLIPIGYTDNGGTICWKTEGDPESWIVVCLAPKYHEGYDVIPSNLTRFLAGLLDGKIAPSTFAPDFFPITRPAFAPYTTQ
jgi:hypothetical protein